MCTPVPQHLPAFNCTGKASGIQALSRFAWRATFVTAVPNSWSSTNKFSTRRLCE